MNSIEEEIALVDIIEKFRLLKTTSKAFITINSIYNLQPQPTTSTIIPNGSQNERTVNTSRNNNSTLT